MNLSFCNSLNTSVTTNNIVSDSDDRKAKDNRDKRKRLLSLLMNSINLLQLYDPKERFELNTNMVQHSNNNNNHNNDAENTPRIVRPIVGHHLIAIHITVKGIPVIAYLSLTSSVTLLLPDFIRTFQFHTINHLKSNRIQNVLGQQSIPYNDDDEETAHHTMVDQFEFQLLDNNNDNTSDD